MPPIHQQRIDRFLEAGAAAATTTDQGRALEDLICYLFESIPGIIVTERNVLNAFGTEEVDVAFWNDQNRQGAWFLPTILLVECKNWSRPVGSTEVASFVRRLENRGLDHGFLVASQGVTGKPGELTDANFQITTALKDGIKVIVIDRYDIQALHTSGDLVVLIKRKLCRLAATGTCI